jgi:hypothetical protein
MCRFLKSAAFTRTMEEVLVRVNTADINYGVLGQGKAKGIGGNRATVYC